MLIRVATPMRVDWEAQASDPPLSAWRVAVVAGWWHGDESPCCQTGGPFRGVSTIASGVPRCWLSWQGRAWHHLVAGHLPDECPKQWLAGHLQMRGRVVLDAGAVGRVREGGSSLLPVGW